MISEVELSLGVSMTGAAVEWELLEAQIEPQEIRAENDRGQLLEPVWQPSTSLNFDGEQRVHSLRLGATPGTYSGLSISIPEGEHALEVHFRRGEQQITLDTEVEMDVMLRCPGQPLTLRPEGQLMLSATLNLSAVTELLDEVDLPDEDDVEINAEHMPELTERLEEVLEASWTLDCSLSPGASPEG